jgi:hypothetical protein
VHGVVDNDESQIPQEKSGENRRPIFHPCGANQQKSNRKCNERRAEAGSFCVRIVWMVMMQPDKGVAPQNDGGRQFGLSWCRVSLVSANAPRWRSSCACPSLAASAARKPRPWPVWAPFDDDSEKHSGLRANSNINLPGADPQPGAPGLLPSSATRIICARSDLR